MEGREFTYYINGRKKTEWRDLANWVMDHQVYSDSNRWLIQIPRIYSVFKEVNEVKSYAELLESKWLENSLKFQIFFFPYLKLQKILL